MRTLPEEGEQFSTPRSQHSEAKAETIETNSSNSGLPISEADLYRKNLEVATGQILIEQKKQTIGWHAILNNATSTRGKPNGGQLFKSLRALTTYVEREYGWDSTLHMPCSYEPNDGMPFDALGTGLLFSFRWRFFSGEGGRSL